MQDSKLYYGLPQYMWDNLLLEAEDLLRNEHIGMHLVGIYPAGARIFGIESAPPGLLCLYVDTVESLINPFCNLQNKDGIYHVRESNSPILMIDLLRWARYMIHPIHDLPYREYLSCIIPPLSDIVYQDDSINEIISIAKELLQKIRYHRGILCTHYKNDIESYLYTRTIYILTITDKFYPCINSEWSKVYNIGNKGVPEYIINTDIEVRRYVTGHGKKPTHNNIQDAIMWMNNTIDEYRYNAVSPASLSERLGQMVSNLYRCLL
jgi:hypothetical protein